MTPSYDQVKKVNIIRNPASSTLENNELKMVIFKNFQPDEILVVLKNPKRAIDGTRATIIVWWVNYLCTMLHGEYLW